MSKGDGGKLCEGISGFTITYSGLCLMGENFSEILNTEFPEKFVYAFSQSH